MGQKEFGATKEVRTFLRRFSMTFVIFDMVLRCVVLCCVVLCCVVLCCVVYDMIQCAVLCYVIMW